MTTPKWRLAKSLNQLRAQINAASPGRSKVSDGSIGDTSHSSRTSDHNPNDQGVVTAIDVTHDPANGVDGKVLSRALTTDYRVKYVIFNSQIWKARTGKWEKYTGPNAHKHHCHVSVLPGRVADDISSAWPWPTVAGKPRPFVIGTSAAPEPQSALEPVSSEAQPQDTSTLAAPKPENPAPQDVTIQPTTTDDKTSKKSFRATVGGISAAFLAWITTNVGEAVGLLKNREVVKWFFIVGGVVLVIYLLRQLIKMVVVQVGGIMYNLKSMQYHADPTTNNVKLASPAPREEPK